MKFKIGKKIYSTRIQVFNPMDLGSDDVINEIKAHHYHTYLVCKRKKYVFLKCDTSNEGFNLSQFYTLTDTHEKAYIEKKHDKSLVVNSLNEGYVDVNLNGVDGYIRDFILFNSLFFDETDRTGERMVESLPTDLEVLYVGQAFGRKERRKIDYRLYKHEKVQKIALEIVGNASFEDVLVVGVCLEVGDLATLSVTRGSFTKKPTKEEIMKALVDAKRSAERRIAKEQEITLFEAALINYFQPIYNKEYKDAFPEPDVVSYAEIFDTDFDYIHMALDSWPIGVRLFSKSVPPKHIHTEHYSLKTENEKEAFIDFLVKE